jgi:hypothetical protein
VYGGNLLLEGGVDEAVALEGVEALEVRGDDEAGEGLAAAAWEESARLVIRAVVRSSVFKCISQRLKDF